MIQHISVKEPRIAYEKRNKGALVFFFLWLTVLIMLRHESVGSDTRNYIRKFLTFDRMGWEQLGKETAEIGFTVFNKIVLVITKNPRIFLMIAAILTVMMIYPTYKRLCTDTSLTIVLFCIMSTFVMMFSGIRQMLAIGMGFVAYEFIRNKKVRPFIITVCVAVTFHTSAFMLAFMYPLYHAKITKKWLYVVVPVLVMVFVFNGPIFSVLTAILGRFTKYEGSFSSTGAYTMLILFAIFAVFTFLIPDESQLDAETIGLRNFLLLSLVIQMFAPLHTLAMRMNYYYIIFIPLLLPKIIECRSKRWNQVAVLGRHVMVVFFLLYFFYTAFKGSALHVFPYHFFWETIG
jgi:hypothetical protein